MATTVPVKAKWGSRARSHQSEQKNRVKRISKGAHIDLRVAGSPAVQSTSIQSGFDARCQLWRVRVAPVEQFTASQPDRIKIVAVTVSACQMASDQVGTHPRDEQEEKVIAAAKQHERGKDRDQFSRVAHAGADIVAGNGARQAVTSAN